MSVKILTVDDSKTIRLIVAKAIQAHMVSNGYDISAETATQERGACPDCGGIVEHEGGCSVCRVCGYSECA